MSLDTIADQPDSCVAETDRIGLRDEALMAAVTVRVPVLQPAHVPFDVHADRREWIEVHVEHQRRTTPRSDSVRGYPG